MKRKRKAKNETAEILEIVNFIKDHMVANMMTREEGATKKDMASGFLRVEERLLSIEQELKDIKRHLNMLEKRLNGVEEYANDIKELRTRVAAIEKQLAARR